MIDVSPFQKNINLSEECFECLVIFNGLIQSFLSKNRCKFTNLMAIKFFLNKIKIFLDNFNCFFSTILRIN
jgi:hypothetical protein